MIRISIDVTADEHKRLKTLAALEGQSIKEFVLSRTLSHSGSADENKAMNELEAMLSTRIHRAETEGASTRSVEDILEQSHNNQSC